MKKIRFAGLLLLAPVVLLSACTSYAPLTFTANWHANTADRSVGNTRESLEYQVTFTSADKNAAFSVEYQTGTYTAELRNDNITLASGATEEGYVYTTRLDLTGHFTLNGTNSDTFTDYVISEVEFLPATSGLRPVRSKKEVHTTSPLSSRPLKLENAFKLYHYTYEVRYDDALENATAIYTDLTKNTSEPEEKTYSVEQNSTYLDNEQILFALRGLSMNSSFTFSSLDSVDGTVAMVNGASLETGSEEIAFTVGGESVTETIETIRLSLYYANGKGGVQRLTYAKRTDVSNNRFRNVLLKMEVPTLHELGTLTYTLTSANFADK